MADPRAAVPHAASPQWQSFESRMRRRRADLCTRRAELALTAGSLIEARAAIDEARLLQPSDAAIGEVVRKVDAFKAANDSHRTRRATGRMLALGLVLIGAAIFGRAVGDIGARPEAAPEAGSAPAVVERGPAAPPPILALAASAAPEPSPAATAKIPEATTGRQAPLPPAGARTTLQAVRQPPEEAETASAPIAGPTVVEAVSAPDVTIPRRDLETLTPAPVSPDFLSVAPMTPPMPVPAAPSLPAGDTASAARAAEPAAASVDHGAAIRAALNRYEAAYSRLDVPGVQAVWPALDSRALARAFDGLTSQRVSLGNCEIDIAAGTARANCAGSAAWTPKVGGGQRTASRSWVFDLRQSEGAWQIVRVAAR